MSRITGFGGQNHFLSNFHPSEVFLDGLPYATVEHAYQASKTVDPGDREIIRESSGPGMAKKLGKHLILPHDWETRKLAVMGDLLWQKFTLHDHLQRKLLGTGTHELIETNWWGDTYWGVCNGVGQNNLGRLLMSVRYHLTHDDTGSNTQ